MHYQVISLGRLVDQPVEWYFAENFDYIIASSGMYRRFYAEPQKYPQERAQYEDLFGALKLIREFSDGGVVIRIFQLPP